MDINLIHLMVLCDILKLRLFIVNKIRTEFPLRGVGKIQMYPNAVIDSIIE